MKYAGLLGDDLSKHLTAKPKVYHPPPIKTPPKKINPVVLLISATGKAHNGSTIPFVSDNV